MEPQRSGNKADHYLHSLVICFGRMTLLGGTKDKMSDRQEAFITAYLKAAGRKHTTCESVRSHWDRVKPRSVGFLEDPTVEEASAQNATDSVTI
jgi:hypothetical protein